MPILRNSSVFEIARGIKAFLNLEAGVTRSTPPKPGWESEAGAEKAGGGNVAPENIVWIFGHGRSGTTWLMRMMEEPESHISWGEPWVGALFGLPYYRDTLEAQRRNSRFILGSREDIWRNQIKNFVLGSANATFPKIKREDTLIIKETDGSIGAPLLMKAMPESRMILLVRDPRDIVASRLDAARKDGWIQGALRNEAPVLTAEQWANILSRHIGNAKEAYEAHKGPKALVRYEDLLSDTLNTMKRVYSSLEMKIDEKDLAQTVDKYSWEKVPEDKKGAGKFYRKATPGGWREDLTPDQVRKIEKIAAPILDEYYADTREA